MKRKINRIKYLLLLIVVFGCYSCKEEFSPFVTGLELNSIGKIIDQNLEEYSYFKQLSEKAGLGDGLYVYNQYGNDYTLFLPTNAAFETFFKNNDVYKSIDDLLADVDFTSNLVRYHILNTGIRSNDFPFGAFADTTLSGDLLSVGFESGLDSVLFLINNEAPVRIRDIEANNGVIHVLERVLTPVIFTNYEWIKDNPDYTILSGLFEITNLKDKMGLTRETDFGNIANNFTLLAEPDSIFHKDSINSLQDLIQKVSNDRNDYTSETNPLYQFAAYHLIEEVYFLDGFEGNKNYNTYSALPVRIAAGARIKINDAPGFHVFDTIIQGKDTSYINFIEPIYNSSNVLTKNGVIHFINNVLYPYKPPKTFMAFGFLNDPVIKKMERNDGTYTLDKETPLTMISWEGPDEIIYHKTSSSGERALNKDYIRIEGDFKINYHTPRVFPATYQVTINANSNYSGNAIVEVFIDGKKIGGNLNFTSGQTSGGGGYREALLGTVEYSDYEPHVVSVRSVLPGRFTWDYIKFTPI
ncbi:MAG: fasciclin domain-containing protein [bacterium]